jgi:two-component system, LuxR family, response regulator FixJ
MKNGAFDFLKKPVDDEVLLDVLRNAIREHTLRHEAHSAEDAVRSRLARMTPREREVLDLLVKGLSEVKTRFAL